MNDTMKSLVFSVITAAIVAAVMVMAFKPQDDQPAGQAQTSVNVEEVERIVASYIDENPQAIIDSLNKMQQRKMQEQQQQASAGIKEKTEELFENPNAPIAGNPDGDVVMVEFFDYNCGFCKKVVPTITELIESDKNLKVVFKEFPILSPSSQQAARAALAVNKIDPSKYFEYHTLLMKHTGQKDEALFTKLAKEVGLDPEEVKKEMDSSEVTQHLNETKALAQALGIRGTPAFIIGEDLIPGAVDTATLRNKIEQTRKAN